MDIKELGAPNVEQASFKWLDAAAAEEPLRAADWLVPEFRHDAFDAEDA